jgi:HSP20 family protein
MATPTRRGGTVPSVWDQFRELRERMDEMLEGGFSTPRLSEWTPAVNVEDAGRELVITAELPGMSRDDVEVELENNVLTIRGEKKMERKEEKEGRHYVYERRFGSFVRSFTLPQSVASDQIRAKFDDGVLTITLPKTEQARSKQVQIE